METVFTFCAGTKLQTKSHTAWVTSAWVEHSFCWNEVSKMKLCTIAGTSNRHILKYFIFNFRNLLCVYQCGGIKFYFLNILYRLIAFWILNSLLYNLLYLPSSFWDIIYRMLKYTYIAWTIVFKLVKLVLSQTHLIIISNIWNEIFYTLFHIWVHIF